MTNTVKTKLETSKPKIIALITALAAFVDFDPELFGNRPWLTSVSKFIMIGGFAAIGFVVKPKNITGGTVAHPDNDPVIVKETTREVSK